MSRFRRIARRIGWGLLALAATLVLVIGLAVAWLVSEAGGRKLRSEILAQAGEQIAGRLALEKVKLSGTGEVDLSGLELYDPDGNLVARIRRVHAKANLRDLVDNKAQIESAKVEDVELYLAGGPQGLNLGRALASKKPPAPERSTGPLDWDIRLDRLEVAGTRVEYRPEPQAPLAFAVRGVGLKGSARYAPGMTKVQLDSTGEITVPLTGPLALSLSASGGSAASPHDPLAVDKLELRAGRSHLSMSGELKGESVTARLKEVLLAAADLRQLEPSLKTTVDLKASGEATYDGKLASVDLVVSPPKGSATVTAKATLSPFKAKALATLRELDLEGIAEAVPATELNGELEASFAQGDLKPGHGELDLRLAQSRVNGVQVESVVANVLTEGEQAKVRTLEVELPGGSISADGSVRSDRIDVSAKLDLSDAESFATAISRIANTAPPKLGGRGQLTATAAGAPSRLKVSLSGKLEQLEVGSLKAEGLSVDALLPNASTPFVFKASLSAGKGQAGELSFRDLDVKLDANRRTFRADLSTKGLAGVQAHLGGELDEDQRGGRLEQVLVETDDARWQLVEPAHLDLRDGFRVDRVVLASGEQWLELRGGSRRKNLDGAVVAHSLDLARLPKIIISPERGLRGIVDVDAKVGGTTEKPQGEARLNAKGLGYDRFQDIDTSGTVSLAAEKARGTLELARHGAQAKATFDLPLELFDAPKGTALAAHVELDKQSLGDLGKLLDEPELKSGQLSAVVELSGTADQPRAHLTARANDVTFKKYPAAGARVEVSSGESSKAHLEVELPGGPLSADATAELSLRTLATEELTRKRLRETAITLTASAPALQLKPWAGTLLPSGIEGRASLEAQLKGSAERPRGEVKLALGDGAYDRFKALRGSLRAALEDKGIDLTAEAFSGQQRAFQLQARLQQTIEHLESLDQLGKGAVDGKAELGPIDVATVIGSEEGATGQIQGSATLSGTLDVPVLEASLDAERLAHNGEKLGASHATARYRDGETNLAVRMLPAAGGNAELTALFKARLGLAAARKGIDLDKAPLEARLVAQKLDLRLANALTNTVRRASGLLDADLSVTGSLSALAPRGTLTLKNGQLSIAGYGTYREVGLDLRVDDRSLQMSRFFARAGQGSFTATMRGERSRENEPYQLTAQLKVDRLPLIIEDQLTATLTAESRSFTGQIAGKIADFNLDLGRTVAELPEAASKDLQSLKTNPDIVVVSGKKKAKEAAAPKEGGFEFKLRIAAPRDVWVQSTDLRIEAGTPELRMNYAQGKVLMSGTVNLLQGRAEVIKRKFTVSRGRLDWLDEIPGNPRLDLLALYENQKEAVKVKVAITGTAYKPKIELSSEPAMPESEIATLLATGRRELKRSSAGVSTGAGAVSVLGAVVTDKLTKAISTQLPVDLKVEIGEGLQKSNIEAGTYLNDDIYVGYRRNFGAETEKENANEVRVEYKVSDHVNVESNYGDANRGGADVVYNKDY